ncbi:MAG: hypothetical protein ABFS34_14360 [Gemmatimonadota bacterium]
MRFANSLILFAALVAAVAVPMFVGFGLSEHHNQWIAYGGAAAVLAAALILLHVRVAGVPSH